MEISSLLTVIALSYALPPSLASTTMLLFPWPKDGSSHSLGQHRAILQLPSNTPMTTAVWSQVEWKRRPLPRAAITDCVLTVAETGEVIKNVVRAPVSAHISSNESLIFVFEPKARDNWITNTGTASRNIVSRCSGANNPNNACWKAADGKLFYDTYHEGWDGEPEKGDINEWIQFDLVVNETIDGFGLYSVDKSDDDHFPIHNPANCTIESAISSEGPWDFVMNGTARATGQLNIFEGFKIRARHWRLTINTRHVSKQRGSHSWIKELRFRRFSGTNKSVPVLNYALYYMPYSWTGRRTGLSINALYDSVKVTASTTWLMANNLTDSVLADGSFKKRLLRANSSIESATQFDSFEPMEMVAAAADTARLLKAHPTDAYLWFPEDRRYQVHMFDQLPQRWIDIGTSTLLEGIADKGEIFAFQLGVWAARKSLTLDNTNVSWSDLTSTGSASPIAAENINCYNLGGINYHGQPFNQSMHVPQGNIGTLWFGVQVPKSTVPGIYKGSLNVAGEHFVFNLTVNDTKIPLPNGGADDLWRMSRLSWLDSTVGIDRNITVPYQPIHAIKGTNRVTVHLSGNRSISIAAVTGGSNRGIIDTMMVGTQQVLATPITFRATGVTWSPSNPPLIIQEDQMSVTIQTVALSVDHSLLTNTTVVVNYDGFVDIILEISNSGKMSSSRTLQNTSIDWKMTTSACRYFMGLGNLGRDRASTYPNGINWMWTQNVDNGQNQFWAGTTTSGLRFKMKGKGLDWDSPLYVMTENNAPTSWSGNKMSGGVSILPSGNFVILTAYSGEVTVPNNNEALQYKFDVLITPLKSLNTARHFRRDRYYQYGYNGKAECPALAEMGVEVLNLHQGVMLNPYINYPFDPVAITQQKNFSDWCKSLGVKKTKIYYTTRELSNRCYEMPTLMALESQQDHIFDNGTGGGASWLQEHLQGGYHRRWSTSLADGELDAAIADTSLTRWTNYYVKGLQWLTENGVKIDGLYLDELSFSRETMQRMRKAVDQHRSGCLFDLHSCNKFHCGKPCPHVSSALTYMAHFAYLDSLWFGEGFEPDSSPDYWLVEMSGIPYGMHAEQLRKPNLWRGMLFADGARPAPALWKAWDELKLTDDGIKLIGWWDNAVPVTTSDSDVLASVYLPAHGSGGVIAIASWKSENVTVKLTIDWKSFGINSALAIITAPEIDDFQKSITLDALAPKVTVDVGKGWIFNVKKKSLSSDENPPSSAVI